MKDPLRIPRFLMEAWQGLVGLEEAVEGLRGSESEVARQALIALASRLEASSSEYGFGRLGHLAGSLVRLARHLPPDGHPSFEDASQLLGETLTVLPMVFENIAAEGSEDLPQLAGLQWRYDAEVAAAEELSQVLAGPPGPVDRALRAFREDDPEALGFFVPEAREHLQGMERSLGQLQTGPDDLDHLHTLFRQVHTLKGAAFTVGCEPVGQVTHWLEDLLVPVREGRIPLRRSALRAASAARDLLQEMVERLDGASGASLQHPYDHLLETFAALLRPESGAAETTRAAAGEEREAEPGIGVATAAEPSSPLDALWHEPPDRQEATAKAEPETAELAVQASVGAGGEIAAPATAAERPMEARDPEAGGRGDGATKKHSLRADFDRIDVLVEPAAELERVGKRLETGLATLDSLVEQTGSGERRAMLLAEALRAADDPNVGGIEARAAGKGLDDLARRSEELAEDLATLRAELRAALGTTQAVRRSLDATTGQLVAGSRAARRVPVGQLFPRFERLVRGAAELGDKSIVLETRGAEVELDHDVLERIADPIIHLLTNAVHHGIESPEARSRAGKEERGTVRIEAAPKGRGILIEVADDGAGLDLEQLRRSAREKGLLRAGYTDPSSEALDLICRPGLTTAATVTTVVGRGVGMDAVRHAVEQLGGKLTVSFGRGSGTRFSIHIPSSRLWLEVLRLGVAESELLIPTDAVEKAHAVIPDRVRRGPDGAPYLERSDSRLELVEAAPRLGLPGPASGNGSAPAAEPHAPQGVAVEVRPRETVFGGDGEASSKRRARALVVDRVNGPEVVSCKDLGELLAPCPLFLGATIASDGRVIPLLDPIALLDLDPDPTPRAALSFPPTVPPPEILIADDSLSVRRVLAGRLEREGYRVTTAKDGQAARHLLARRPFSAVITDLEMPRSSGDALIADLRHRPSTRGLPVAVITTRSSSRHRELAEELGADLYLPKPVDLEALLAWLSSVLAEPHGDRKGP